MTKRDEVAEVLQAFKLSIEYCRCDFVPRSSRSIDQDLSDLNITRTQALEEICSLVPSSYCKGPEPDDLEPEKDIWIFGSEINGVQVYIKLRLIKPKRGGLPRCAVWSFHKAEHPMSYPLREGGR